MSEWSKCDIVTKCWKGSLPVFWEVYLLKEIFFPLRTASVFCSKCFWFESCILNSWKENIFLSVWLRNVFNGEGAAPIFSLDCWNDMILRFFELELHVWNLVCNCFARQYDDPICDLRCLVPSFTGLIFDEDCTIVNEPGCFVNLLELLEFRNFCWSTSEHKRNKLFFWKRSWSIHFVPHVSYFCNFLKVLFRSFSKLSIFPFLGAMPKIHVMFLQQNDPYPDQVSWLSARETLHSHFAKWWFGVSIISEFFIEATTANFHSFNAAYFTWAGFKDLLPKQETKVT